MPNLSDTSDLNTLVGRLPKVELHRHLEGSIRLETLLEVAHTYHLNLPARTPEGLRPHVQVMPTDPMDAVHFLQKFSILRQFFCAPEVIQRIAREAVEDAARDGVKYMELRFTPKALAKLKGFSYPEVVEWVGQAVMQAQQLHDIQVRLIVAVNRHETVQDAEWQLDAALACRDVGVVGFDLCGQEYGYPATPFFPLFREAQAAGLGVTLHAGEWDSAYNIEQAILELGVTRIGHGVRVLENHRVAQLALEAGVTFEVCPTSNIQTGVVHRFTDHPFWDMLMLGLRVTLNTDDPSISGITLSDEYRSALSHLNLNIDQLRTCIQTAVESAFLPEAERVALSQSLAL